MQGDLTYPTESLIIVAKGEVWYLQNVKHLKIQTQGKEYGKCNPLGEYMWGLNS